MTTGPRRLALALLFGLLDCTSEGVMPEPRVLDPPKPLPHVDRTGPPALPAVPPWPEASEQTDMEARRFFLERFGEAPKAFSSEPPPRVTALALENTARGDAPGMRALGYLRTAVLAEGQRAVMPLPLTPKECVSLIAQGGLGVIEVDLFLTQGTHPAGADELSAPDGGAPDGGAADGGAADGGPTDGGAADGGAPSGSASNTGAAASGASDGGALKGEGGASDADAQGASVPPGSPVPTILAQDNDLGAIAVIGSRTRCFAATGAGAPNAELHIVVRRGAGPVVVEGYYR